MLFQKISLISALAAFAVAQNVDSSDIPQQCQAICGPLVATSQRCDNETNDDRAEVECICRSPNAGTLIPQCDACVEQFDTDNDDDVNDESDVRELLRGCNLTTTTYNSASAGSILSSISMAPSATGGAVVVTTSGTVVRTTSVPAATNTVIQQSRAAAAPAHTVAAGAAFGLGALGVAMGFM